MRKLYFFNPDTDYALASGSVVYTPKRAVLEMARRMTLLPALWADNGSVILSETKPEKAIEEAHESIREIIETRYLTVTGFEEAAACFGDEIPELCLWGRNRCVEERLARAGLTIKRDSEKVHKLRLETAHRRNTISLNRYLAEKVPETEAVVPEEAFTLADVKRILHTKNCDCYIKDPWSSAGRGIINTSGQSEEIIEQWCIGVIRRHGSVMIEPAAIKKADCSSLWEIKKDREGNRVADFIGFSVFKTSKTGKYEGQIVPDKNGKEYIRNTLPFLNDTELSERLKTAQRDWLLNESETLHGYVGIDMLVDIYGNLRPAIEINRRMTMGIAAYLIAEKCPDSMPLPYPFIRI